MVSAGLEARCIPGGLRETSRRVEGRPAWCRDRTRLHLRVASLAGTTRCTTNTRKFGPPHNEKHASVRTQSVLRHSSGTCARLPRCPRDKAKAINARQNRRCRKTPPRHLGLDDPARLQVKPARNILRRGGFVDQ
jgi:hypothetical protein